MGEARQNRWIKIRKFFNDIHLWGGLISGIVVFIVCFTGTIYVYNTELREAAIPQYYRVDEAGTKLSADSLLELAKPHIEGKVIGVKIPYAANATTAILYSKAEKKSEKQSAQEPVVVKGNTDSTQAKIAEVKAEPKKAGPPQGGGRRRSNQVMVNPYTGDVIGDASDEKTRTAEFMGVMFSLHRWLMLNEIKEPIFEGIENRKLGSWISGTATLLFLLGVLSGLVIWFPKKMRSWKKGFNIRWSANWKRVNHDLHNTLGLYTWIFLFLMSVTGPFWSFEWYREGWQKTWGTYQAPRAKKDEAKLSSVIVPNKGALTIEELVVAVNKVLPYHGDITVNLASDSLATVSVSKNRVGFFAASAGDKLTLDQYSGEVLEQDIFREKSFRNRIGSSIKALHIGDVYGQFSKLLYFISCLVATSLPVTGVLIWVNKMKKKPKKQRYPK